MRACLHNAHLLPLLFIDIAWTSLLESSYTIYRCRGNALLIGVGATPYS